MLGALAGAGTTAAWLHPDRTTPPTVAGQPDPARVAELERAEAERNAQSLEALATFGVGLQDELAPVLEGLHGAHPSDGSTRRTPTGEDVDEWRASLEELAVEADALPSGGTEHNMVRSGFVLTLELLGSSVDLVEQALSAEPASDETLFRLAGAARDHAVDAFGSAAMQLDNLYVTADKGHLHLVLRAGEGGVPLDDPHGHPGH
ncbi:hypothetical protein L600_000800000850 [Isoptericola variabilis J7]|uniref:Uncharacterized protein n=2 Tax=Isoptericola TaxID=254250 RepID=F6FQL8_ISOV2|nr:hypothetical protein Isova_2194 [Isoptericola variabilis 225]TWH26074.1 hypothetical protein L600_000800000850 [Isoptericola variabilis J7]